MSVVIPAFNAASMIEDNVVKLREFLLKHAEHVGNFEIVVVDDGSQDGTGAVVSGVFENVRVICLPQNRGKGAAVRAGRRCASSVAAACFIGGVREEDIARLTTSQERVAFPPLG